MYIKRNLIQSINDDLYRQYLSEYPELKAILPLKITDPDIVNKVIDCRNTLQMMDNEINRMFTDFIEHSTNPTAIYASIQFSSQIAKKLQTDIGDMGSYDVLNHLAYHQDNEVIAEVCSILGMYDRDACLVGGAVRDIIRNGVGHVDINDYDFVSKLPYDDLISLFESNEFEIKETGRNFLVLNVIKNGVDVEIANFRKDGTYLDGRRPDTVSIGTIADDAFRRDFTVNALYYNMSNRIVLDPTGYGYMDLKANKLQFIGNPNDRLDEDGLRAFRFYRFINKGFIPYKKSLNAVRRRFASVIAKTDSVRINKELDKMVGICK
jgi:hypothetical protein